MVSDFSHLICDELILIEGIFFDFLKYLVDYLYDGRIEK
jgi:hypothetical protein